MRKGFYTAVGTPLDEDGHLLADSFAQQVIDQVEFGASGLLVMGSMGLGVFVRTQDYVEVAKTSIQAAKKRCPVFIGVTDTSIARVYDRLDSLQGLDIDGVVATAPYYYAVTDAEVVNFYKAVARYSSFPLYLYDLPTAARNKITAKTMASLLEEKNIKGIKTADWDLVMHLKEKKKQGIYPSDFYVFYSGLDTFDKAYDQEVTYNLDGMFACTGPQAQSMYTALAKGDGATGSQKLAEIVSLRDIFAQEHIFPSFTYAMNKLGYAGAFHPDFYLEPSEAQKDRITNRMRELKLI